MNRQHTFLFVILFLIIAIVPAEVWGFEELTDQELMQPGVLSCQGCGGSIAMKLALKGLGRNTVIVLPASCMSIIAGVWPYTAIQVPILHVPFATAAVAASGVRAALDVKHENSTSGRQNKMEK